MRRVPKSAKKHKKGVVNHPKSTPARGQTNAPLTTPRTCRCPGCMRTRADERTRGKGGYYEVKWGIKGTGDDYDTTMDFGT